MAEMIALAEIAKRLNIDTSSVRRLIAREAETLGLEIHRGKGDKLLLTADDANSLIASYQARRGPATPSAQENAKYDRFGFFYIIQLIPEALANRVKIGFADDVERRLAEHRTAAPTAKLVKAWPCKRSWDYAVMDCITREGCKHVLSEVFEGEIEGFVSRGDAFFSQMPSPDSERELSEYSPLFEPSDTDAAQPYGAADAQEAARR